MRATKAALLLQLGRVEEAQALYRQLLELNPDDYSVHEGLHRYAPMLSALCFGQVKEKQPGKTVELAHNSAVSARGHSVLPDPTD